MSRMTATQEARFRDLSTVVRRAREGGAFEEVEKAYWSAERWSGAERDLVRDAWGTVESILGDDAPRPPAGTDPPAGYSNVRTDPEWQSWRAALTILGLLGDGHEGPATFSGVLAGVAITVPIGDGPWHGGAPGYFLESIVCGDLPDSARDLYRRVSSHLAWEPKTTKERVVAARRRAAAMRKALRLKDRHV